MLPNSNLDVPRDVWQAVASGHWTLSERFERDGLCHLVLTRNARTVRSARALSRSEEATVRGSALGLANKYLAHELARSPSAISSTLRRARSKLGVRSRLELAQLLRCASCATLRDASEQVTLSCPAPAPKTLAVLTSSERAVFLAVLDDLSNQQIAKMRGSSPRTIANQVASIFRKLNAGSRGELVAKYSNAVSDQVA